MQHSQPVVISAAKPLHNWHHLVMSSQPEGSLSRISLSPGRRRRGVLLARRLGLLVLKPLSRQSVSHGWIWRAMTITSRGERKMNGLFFWIISLIFHLSHPLILLKSQVSTFYSAWVASNIANLTCTSFMLPPYYMHTALLSKKPGAWLHVAFSFQLVEVCCCLIT